MQNDQPLPLHWTPNTLDFSTWACGHWMKTLVQDSLKHHDKEDRYAVTQSVYMLITSIIYLSRWSLTIHSADYGLTFTLAYHQRKVYWRGELGIASSYLPNPLFAHWRARPKSHGAWRAPEYSTGRWSAPQYFRPNPCHSSRASSQPAAARYVHNGLLEPDNRPRTKMRCRRRKYWSYKSSIRSMDSRCIHGFGRTRWSLTRGLDLLAPSWIVLMDLVWSILSFEYGCEGCYVR